MQIAGAPAPRSRPTGRHLLTVQTGVRSDTGYLIMKSDDSNNISGFSHQRSIRICHSPWGVQPAYQPAHYHIPGIIQQPSQPLVTTFLLHKISRNAKNIRLECTLTHAAILFLCACIPTILLSADGSRYCASEDLQRRQCGRNNKQHRACLPCSGRINRSLERKTSGVFIYDTLNHAFNK